MRRNLTRQQKIFVSSRGLKPENWYLEQETVDYYQIISKNGQRRMLSKNEEDPKFGKEENE